jgi:NAD(P)-dependent dehydrogenase (short-subunit alcohol dehydrogenase family)
MHGKPVALVTGANQGIGFQMAKDLTAHGFTVLVGSRNLERGQAAANEIGPEAHAVELDVTQQETIRTAAQRIRQEFGRLDVLINNAGISHAKAPGRSLTGVSASGRASAADLDEVRAVFDANVFGVMAVTQAMLPLLREAPAARIVNVSSITGSLSWNFAPQNPYRSMFGLYAMSKAALNAVTVGFAFDLESTGIKVNAACPGFTRKTSTIMRAREPWKTALRSRYVSPSWGRTARLEPFPTPKGRFPGESNTTHSRPASWHLGRTRNV